MSHSKYRALFPHLQFSEAGNQIRLPHGGSRSAFTPTGALTGRGADFIIIDDPQGSHEADRAAESARICHWYDQSIYQRLDHKDKGVVILLMQRVAHDDLTAHLLGRGGWELLSLPAIAIKDERFPGVFGERVLRKKGEALNPAREDLSQLREALLQMGAKGFMAQYQQEPYPPGEGEGCGAFHFVPRPDAREGAERSSICLGRIPEETFVLEELFGECSGIRRGPPPPMAISA
jgi:hypothetical protein